MILYQSSYMIWRHYINNISNLQNSGGHAYQIMSYKLFHGVRFRLNYDPTPIYAAVLLV